MRVLSEINFEQVDEKVIFDEISDILLKVQPLRLAIWLVVQPFV